MRIEEEPCKKIRLNKFKNSLKNVLNYVKLKQVNVQSKIWKISGLPIIKSLFDFDSESASDYTRHTDLIRIYFISHLMRLINYD